MSRRVTQGGGRIQVDPTVPEGGTITVTASGEVEELDFLIPGGETVTVPVVDGVAEFRVPPSVKGGTKIVITDKTLPKPSEATVTVTGSNN